MFALFLTGLAVTLAPAYPGVLLMLVALSMRGRGRVAMLVVWATLFALSVPLIVFVGWPTFGSGNPYHLF